MLFKFNLFSQTDDILNLKIKKFQLKNRAARAVEDTTDYELKLRDFCTRNRNNLALLTSIQGLRLYLIKTGSTPQQAAKETLEQLQH